MEIPLPKGLVLGEVVFQIVDHVESIDEFERLGKKG
jgi:hypothetical protein